MKNGTFEEENESTDLSKSEVNARRILKRIHDHDMDQGGTFSLSTGAQGSAKTSVMLSFMSYTLLNYPQEKLFWSNCYFSPMQFVKIGTGRFHIMVKENSNVTFHDRTNKLKQVYPKITIFKDYQDLYGKAQPGICNGVFFGDRMLWMGFIHYLRSVGTWNHVFIDELSEISPAFTGGKLWKQIRDFAVDVKEIRKCMINLHTNTQAISDIDHRIRNKIMIKIFMPGSKTGKDSRLTQTALDNLDEDPINGNQSYLEHSGRFGKIRFKDIFKPDPKMLWEARVNEN